MQYLKWFVMVVATVATALVPVLVTGHHLTLTEEINVALVGIGAMAVFTGENVPGHQYTKLALAAMAAALTAINSFVGAGGLAAVTPAEWIQVGLAILAAFGVFAFPNVGSKLAKA